MVPETAIREIRVPQILVDKMEVWNLDRLVPSARNARSHPETQITELADSMSAFGEGDRRLLEEVAELVAPRI